MKIVSNNFGIIKYALASVFGALSLPWVVDAATINPASDSTPVDLKVVIIGDSTVAAYTPTEEKRGWGQIIPDFFDARVSFDDRAKPGRSSKTFITEGLWGATLGTLKSGDYVLIQFGHNDSHDPANPEATDASGDYKTCLQRYIGGTRAKGAIPVLVTPMHRRSFDAKGRLRSYLVDDTGHHYDDLQPYVTAMKQVAQANQVPCIDLFTLSGDLMQKIGNDACIGLLAKGDVTHWNEKGAIAMASLVTRGLAGSDESLKAYIRPGAVPSVRTPGSAPSADAPAVSDAPFAQGDFALLEKGRAASVVYSSGDAKVVEIAAGLFAGDVQRVSGVLPSVKTSRSGVGGSMVLIGTIGQSPDLDALITAGKVDVSAIAGGWEQYHIEVVDNPFPGVTKALVIAGSDRRGTAYGVFSLSEAMGVSPWYWWADSNTKHRPAIHVSATPFSSRTPSVRYRGIFLNDEDWGLHPWAAKTFDSATGDIGPKTYAKIFELLLRLKANCIWPAMHPCTKAFNLFPENKVVADNYAIVMGSSHAEPMLRNNVYEWSRFVSANGYSKNWNYAENKAAIYDYWEQRAIANGRYENLYTLGKRGIHDSGMVEGRNNTEKAGWLNTIFADQRTILSQHVSADLNDVGQIFVPYKEVLGIYDTGLVNVPDDVTLVWPDDNHGYIRRLSDPVEQLRSGGGGVYYHISYWGAPADYLWLCSTPPALIWEEMTKAFDYNCSRFWILNVGDIKPGEIDMEFFLRMAWDINRYGENAQTIWLKEWATREFGADHAADIASVLNEYYKLGFERKPEHMNWKDTDPLTPSGPYPLFSNVHYGDEAGKRLAAYADLVRRADALYSELPAGERSAFYETVLYPIRGADGMNRKFLNAGRAFVASVQGRNTVDARKADSRAGYHNIQIETAAYNALENGKWNRMMDSKPRSQSVFKQPALPASPTLGNASLGVAIEGRLEPAFLTAAGIVYKSLPGYINLNAANDGVLTAPMQVATIGGRQAIWTPGSDNVAHAPGETGAGKAVYTFNVATAGSYTLACEVNCPSVDDDSWHIQLDDGPVTVWNNLSNGGAWGYATFGAVSLTAGQHTLTVYEREDGAAMAAIRLTSADTVLVEDQARDSFRLPEFSAHTRRSCFIDLFNTGTGSVAWTATAADSWVQVSQASGSVSGEDRLQVSIDWATAPRTGELSSSVTVSSGGQSLAIPVDIWNPGTALPAGVDFVEDNGCVSIEADHYSTLTPALDGTTWTPVFGLGRGAGAMMVSPDTAASRADVAAVQATSPSLDYRVYLREAGTVTVTVSAIPTLATNGGGQLRYAVSFDDEAPQLVDMARVSGTGSVWSRSVLRARINYATKHTLVTPGEHTIRIWMVDPGVVLDHILISTGAVPHSYDGPPETRAVR